MVSLYRVVYRYKDILSPFPSSAQWPHAICDLSQGSLQDDHTHLVFRPPVVSVPPKSTAVTPSHVARFVLNSTAD